MQYIKILSVPRLVFAHVFGAERYFNTLSARKNFIEISFITAGTLKKTVDGISTLYHVHEISCNDYTKTLKVNSEHYHQHHTVGFEVAFECSDTPKDGFSALPETIPVFDKIFTLHKTIDKIIELSENHDTAPITLSGLFLQLLGQIDSAVKTPSNNFNYLYDYYTDKAKEYIAKNLRKSITQKEIAEYLNVTPQYLCSVFKMGTGETIVKYVNKYKLKQIKILTERENVKLKNAAAAYGYSDPNYVSRLYKKYFGKNLTDKE